MITNLKEGKNKMQNVQEYNMCLRKDVHIPKRVKHNCGSATVEMTLLMPIILGIFYLYISFFIFFIDCAGDMKNMAETLYANGAIETTQNKGSKSSIYIQESSGIHKKRLELHRYNGDTVKNIRRWQLAADTVLSGGNP